MLTYVPPSHTSVDSQVRPEKPWLLLLLCFLWLVPGLLGHDPWKPAENQTAEIVRHFLATDHWAVPRIAGEAYLVQAPLYYWIAALLAKPLSLLGLSLHDIARLSSGLWMALAFLGLGLAGYELHGRRQGRLSVVLMLSCVGLLLWGHLASPAVLVLAAFCWQSYALILMLRRPLPAGGILGLVWLALLIGASWAECALALAMTLLLPIFPVWRRLSFGAALATALAIAIPLGVLWPLALYNKEPLAFQAWWSTAAWGPFNTEHGLSLFHSPGFLPSIVVWFAWPALPLAAWAVWSCRAELKEPRFQMLGLMLVLVVLWLSMSASPNEAQTLLLLPVLALIATPGVDDLRRGAAAALNWFGILALGAAACVLWGGWLALLLGWPADLAADLRQHSPTFRPVLGLGFLYALALTVAWVHVLLRKRAFGRRALVAWACGITLLWSLLNGLWLGWLDVSKSYRSVGNGLAQQMAKYPGACVSVGSLDDARLAAFSYFGGLSLRKGDEGCPYHLLHGQAADAGVVPGDLLWIGARPGEKDERFYLYQMRVQP